MIDLALVIGALVVTVAVCWVRAARAERQPPHSVPREEVAVPERLASDADPEGWAWARAYAERRTREQLAEEAERDVRRALREDKPPRRRGAVRLVRRRPPRS